MEVRHCQNPKVMGLLTYCTAQLIAFLDDVFKSVYNVVSSRQPNSACRQKMSGTVEKSGHLIICREWGPPNVSSSASWYWKMPYVFSDVFLSGRFMLYCWDLEAKAVSKFSVLLACQELGWSWLAVFQIVYFWLFWYLVPFTLLATCDSHLILIPRWPG